MRISGIAAAWLVLSTTGAIAQPSPDAKSVVRALVRAMAAHDTAAYERLTLPDPRRSVLIRGGPPNRQAVEELDANPEAVQVRQAEPYLLKGQEVTAEPSGGYAVGTTARFVAAYRSGPVVVSLVRQQDGWKVDLRWWLAMYDMQSAPPPLRDSPEFAIRAMTAALIRLDRKGAMEFAGPDADVELLFDGAPRQREPSGHLDALVGEMPLVEIGPGEFSILPSGQAVEGVKRDDMKVIVGQFGTVEIPYVVRRVGTAWKVQAEPYFLLIER
jgi:hypothetical protein